VLPLSAFGWTDVGRKRTSNEDFYAVDEPNELFVLADGMGGHNSGEVASRLAVQHLTSFLTDLARRPGFQFSREVPPCDDRDQRRVHAAIQYANERVYIESMKDRRFDGMGTTLLVAWGAGERIVLAHVGDSRIYRLRGGQLTQVTKDHSWLNHMVQTGQMTREAASSAKGKNVIMRAVGLKGSVLPDVQSVERVAGDLYLFCSDGLTDLVEDWILRDVLDGEGDDLYTAARALVKLANDYGGRDNCTVILLKVGGGAPPGKAEPADPSSFDADTDKIAIVQPKSPEHGAEPAPAARRAPRVNAPNVDAPRRPLAHDDVDARLLSEARARRGKESKGKS
jgi:protein phosphatase